MGEYNLILKTILVLSFVFAGSAFAAGTCSEDAYRSSCSSCPFDNATGKMDKQCYEAKQASGVGCLMGEHSMAAIKYQTGECPAIDKCLKTLGTCKSGASTGNDFNDCQSGKVSNCFAQADMCVEYAASECEGVKTCPFAMVIMLLAGTVFLAGFAGRQ